MTIAMIKNPAISSPVNFLVPKTMFFKVFITCFSVGYKKVFNGFNKFFHIKTPLTT